MVTLPRTVKKPDSAIVAHADGPKFTLVDRKLFNALLAKAKYDIRRRSVGPHRIRLLDLADLLLEGYETRQQVADFKKKVRGSLDRLATVNVSIYYMDGEVQYAVRRPYLSYPESRVDGTEVVYAFDETIMAFLFDTKVYGTIDLAASSRLKSIHALRLYETMTLYYRRWCPVWECSVDELRAHMELGNRYPRFEIMRTHVIKKAVDEINEKVEQFSISVRYIRSGQRGKVERICFEAYPKAASNEALPGLRQPAMHLAQNIPETFDSITDGDYPGPPDIGDGTIEHAMTITGGTLEEVLRDRDVWFALFGAKTHRRPDEAFLAWLRIRKMQSSRGLLDVDVDSLFDKFLSQPE